MAEQTPRVSVVMPAYNVEKYVAEAVESILSQTFGDFEFIIVDDGSTDGTGAILSAFARKDDRIRLIRQENKGLCGARNAANAQARGELLAIMDADDVALPDRLRMQLDFLDQHEDVVLVGGSFHMIDEKGRFLTILYPPEDGKEIQELMIRGHTAVHQPCAMVRKSAVERVGGYDESFQSAEDLDLWLRLGEIGKLANLKEPVLKYRLRSSSISGSKGSFQRDIMRRACEKAWERRGITDAVFEATEPFRPTEDAASLFKFHKRYGWWAFNSAQRSTAILYGLKAVAVKPFCLSGWRLLACSLVKKMKR